MKDLATEIAAGLIEYDQNVADEIKTIVDDVAQEGVDELKQSSPKLTGSYRRGWRKKQTHADTRTKRNTVFNKTDYQITHLLEYGHASRNGGRVKPSVHIKPVEEKMITELQERIEKAVQQ
ncbi:HK97 gp10 family phage protein [Blautia sp. AF17-9LB]|nr:HK97 gp10 family phage protein [Blautia sp. AF17-9LB]